MDHQKTGNRKSLTIIYDYVQNYPKWEFKINLCDDSWFTPLFLAAKLNLPLFAETLLEIGVQINTGNSLGQSPLDIAKEKGHDQVVHILEKHQQVREQKALQLKLAPLFSAMESYCQKQNPSLLVHIEQLARETDLSSRSCGLKGCTPQATPLYLAASNNLADVATILLQAGADVWAGSCFGYSPLKIAILNEHREVSNVLFQHMITTHHNEVEQLFQHFARRANVELATILMVAHEIESVKPAKEKERKALTTQSANIMTARKATVSHKLFGAHSHQAVESLHSPSQDSLTHLTCR